MAKQILEAIKQAELSAQAKMEKAKAEADRLLEQERESCREMEQNRAGERTRRSEEAVKEAERLAAEKRGQILETYRAQEQKLREDAGKRLPEAVSCVTAFVTGR